MISPNRFLASKSLFPQAWTDARRLGVTATMVAKAASGPGGFEQLLAEFEQEWIEPDNPYMKFGRDWEPIIALQIKREFALMPNDWLIQHDEFAHHLATPDCLSLDHRVIGEIKTTGKDWEEKKIPIQYRRQVQWQLHVTGADFCVFSWMLREERDGVFAPAWFDAKSIEIQRDEDMIEQLIETAEKLWERINNGSL